MSSTEKEDVNNSIDKTTSNAKGGVYATIRNRWIKSLSSGSTSSTGSSSSSSNFGDGFIMGDKSWNRNDAATTKKLLGDRAASSFFGITPDPNWKWGKRLRRDHRLEQSQHLSEEDEVEYGSGVQWLAGGLDSLEDGGNQTKVQFSNDVLFHEIKHLKNYTDEERDALWVRGKEYRDATYRNKKEYEYEEFHRGGAVVEEEEFVLHNGSFIHPVHLPLDMWKI